MTDKTEIKLEFDCYDIAVYRGWFITRGFDKFNERTYVGYYPCKNGRYVDTGLYCSENGITRMINDAVEDKYFSNL